MGKRILYVLFSCVLTGVAFWAGTLAIRPITNLSDQRVYPEIDDKDYPPLVAEEFLFDQPLWKAAQRNPEKEIELYTLVYAGDFAQAAAETAIKGGEFRLVALTQHWGIIIPGVICRPPYFSTDDKLFRDWIQEINYFSSDSPEAHAQRLRIAYAGIFNDTIVTSENYPTPDRCRRKGEYESPYADFDDSENEDNLQQAK